MPPASGDFSQNSEAILTAPCKARILFNTSNFAEAKIEHARAEICCKTGILEEYGTIGKEKRQAIIQPLKAEASGAGTQKLRISRKFGTTGGNSARRRAKKPEMSDWVLLIRRTVLVKKVANKTF